MRTEEKNMEQHTKFISTKKQSLNPKLSLTQKQENKAVLSGNIYKSANGYDKDNNGVFALWPWIPFLVSVISVPFMISLGGTDLDKSNSNIILLISRIITPLGILASLFISLFLISLPNRKSEAILLLICSLVIFPIYFIFCYISITSIY